MRWYDACVTWLTETLEGFGIPESLTLAVLLLLLLIFVASVAPIVLINMFLGVFALAPLWLPPLLAYTLWHMWMKYVQARFLAKTEMILLEIKVPRDIEKSPRAMELFFAGIHNVSSGDGTFIARWIEGKVRPWWSFEIISDEGRIRFFIWLRKGLRIYTEAQLYAQYPGIEIYEVPDYAVNYGFDLAKHNIWGCNFKLGKDDVFPIKSYIDYGLDKDPKEEYKVDPIAHLFEFLSTLKSGEQAWIQIMVRSNKDVRPKEGTWFKTENRWQNEAKDAIKKIKEDATPKIEGPDGTKRPGFMSLTPADEQKIDALSRSLEKSAFDTGIRGIYVGRKENYNGARIAGLTGVFKQFSSGHLNNIVPFGYHAVFDYPWQEWFDAYNRMSKKLMDAYMRRSWFYPPHKTEWFVMTSEELATIFHFPSRSILAPGLDRIPARKAEPPPNLPI